MPDQTEFYNTLWDATLKAIKDDSNSEIANDFIYNTYIKECKLVKLENKDAYILVEDSMAKDVLNTHKEIITDYFNKASGSEYVLNFITDTKSIIKSPSPTVSEVIEGLDQTNLNPKYSFDNFVEGNNNRNALKASKAVTAAPGKLYNPLFIYSKPGMGKTHLVQAIGNEIKKLYPNMRVLYNSSQNMVEDIQKVINKNKKSDKYGNNEWLEDKYQNIDVLIIDDIQMLAGNSASQEMFFNFYNNLEHRNKQIIITSDVYPDKLNGLQDRLTSRFKQGSPFNISDLEIETSIEILKSKLQGQAGEDEIPIQALEYIAKNFSSDVRELEGTLRALLFAIINRDNDEPIDMAFVHDVFKDIIGDGPSGNITEKDIISVVCSFYNINQKEVMSQSRAKNTAHCRHVCVYLIRELLNTPFKKIGKTLGNRDHTTCMSSYKKIAKGVKENNELLFLDLSEIKDMLKS